MEETLELSLEVGIGHEGKVLEQSMAEELWLCWGVALAHLLSELDVELLQLVEESVDCMLVPKRKCFLLEL